MPYKHIAFLDDKDIIARDRWAQFKQSWTCGITYSLTFQPVKAHTVTERAPCNQVFDKTALIKRLGRKLVSANFTQSYWRLFSLTFLSSALLNNTAIVASLIGPIKLIGPNKNLNLIANPETLISRKTAGRIHD